ncbi:transporter [Desulfonema ishimotonii]|uniref:Transporter n=1 Tax=Desulfonema ishimotonii TaxID=45657 RepID=A0A401FVL1_9BACT|nr:AEC family transporter [Desulfonema ishimotonii]GBC61001.1 transporter [Desulfonema ishimotonii]
MFRQFLSVFAQVIIPVFGLVMISYVAGPKLKLEARTLSRTAYYLFIPAFVFDIFSKTRIEAALVARMAGYITVVHLLCVGVAILIAKLLKRPRDVVGGYILIAIFGNVGNFGLSLIDFRLGKAALVPATFYFIVLSFLSFVIGISAASWARGGGIRAVLSVFRTPALIAFALAALTNVFALPVPLFVTRMAGLLGQAMIPVMLVVLGLQMAATGRIRITADMCAASAVRLLIGPLMAFLLAFPFGITGTELATGILQSGMPAAIITTIIAIEYDLVPEFVTHTVLFSTIVSFFSLTLLLSLI